jgi:hypothetical protein
MHLSRRTRSAHLRGPRGSRSSRRRQRQPRRRSPPRRRPRPQLWRTAPPSLPCQHQITTSWRPVVGASSPAAPVEVSVCHARAREGSEEGRERGEGRRGMRGTRRSGSDSQSFCSHSLSPGHPVSFHRATLAPATEPPPSQQRPLLRTPKRHVPNTILPRTILPRFCYEECLKVPPPSPAKIECSCDRAISHKRLV